MLNRVKRRVHGIKILFLYLRILECLEMKLLIVEDELELLNSTCVYLQKEDFICEPASNFFEALPARSDGGRAPLLTPDIPEEDLFALDNAHNCTHQVQFPRLVNAWHLGRFPAEQGYSRFTTGPGHTGNNGGYLLWGQFR